MRDATPRADGATTESEGDPSSGNAAVLAEPSTHSQPGASVAVGTSADSAQAPESPRPGNEEHPSAPLPAEGDGSEAAPPRSRFGFGRVLKSAVRALTGEREPATAVDLSPKPEREPDGESAPVPQANEFSEPESPPAQAPPQRPVGLSGHTSTVAIPEVLGFIAQLRKSGTLWIWNDREQFRIQLVDGNVVFARDESTQRGWLLGEVLVSQGAIDSTTFAEFLKQPREPGPLGDALLKAGLVDAAALRGAVQFQAQKVFNRAYGLGDAYFSFDGNPDMGVIPAFQISVTQMLFESARARDESEQRLSSVFDDPFGEV